MWLLNYTRVLQEWIEGYQGALLVIVELYSDLEGREQEEKQTLIPGKRKIWATDFVPGLRIYPWE